MTRITTSILFLLLFCCVLPGKIKSQTIPNKKAVVKTFPVEIGFTIGNLKGSRMNVDSFKAQKMINMTNDRFSFQSANVYFGGNGFGNVAVATLSGNSLSSIAALINRCNAGSVVSFDNIKVSGPDGLRVIEGRSFTLYNGTYDSTRIAVSTANEEAYQLMKKIFISGTVYFSGSNFPNVVIQPVKKDELINLFMRCGPGSIISFENCVYKNEDNTVSKPFTKTIKLD